MLLFEILVAIVLLAFIANGVKAGAVETLGRVIGAVIGFIAARTFAGWLIGIVSLVLPVDWAFTISFLAIFMLVDYVVGLLFKLAENLLKIFTRLPILKQINGILGGIFGLFEGVIVIGGVSWLIKQSAAESGTEVITSLKIVGFINQIFESIFLKLL
jgi:uncharacterized membrane protein required for colicin V production